MKKTVGIMSVAALLLVLYVGMVWAGGGDPGSASDPLVTRSFVEKYVEEKLADTGGGGQWQVEKNRGRGNF
ncbi:MAG: hypothetical protein LRZ99_06110 [Desulfotomaculum sp.]|nr:hypothetical protein [Desulfotomaculum sp.]